jgi:RNA 3'-terminal phosphate cyclase
VEAIRQLVGGVSEGVTRGSQEIAFRPGKPSRSQNYTWDIGSAGSTTSLAIAVLPPGVRSISVSVELREASFRILPRPFIT